MTYEEKLKEYERFNKIYKSKLESHYKKFYATVVESSYQDSCTVIDIAYNNMRIAGEKVGIIHPVML